LNALRLRLAVIYFGFALTGVVVTMLGPILPLLSSSWSLNYAQAGRLFTVQFLLSVLGALIAFRVANAIGTARTVLTGMVLISFGVALAGIGGRAVGTTGIAIYGVGLGFAIPCTNLMVSEMMPANRAAALNLLNFAWTIGALTAPVIIQA
jgi:MFS family permease